MEQLDLIKKSKLNVLKMIDTYGFIPTEISINSNLNGVDIFKSLFESGYIYTAVENGQNPYLDMLVYKITRKGKVFLYQNEKNELYKAFEDTLKQMGFYSEYAMLGYLGTLNLDSELSFEDYYNYCLLNDLEPNENRIRK